VLCVAAKEDSGESLQIIPLERIVSGRAADGGRWICAYLDQAPDDVNRKIWRIFSVDKTGIQESGMLWDVLSTMSVGDVKEMVQKL